MEVNRAPDGLTHEAPRFAELKRRLSSFLLGLTAWAILLALIIPPLKAGLAYLFNL